MAGNLADVRCEYCGWRGDVTRSPRKMLVPESYRQWGERLQRKRDGRVFVVRVAFDGRSRDRVVDEVMRELKLTSAGTRGSRMMVELESRPDDAVLERLRALRGVQSVDLA